MEKANDLIEDILKKNRCSASECRSENLENLDTDGLIYFKALLEDTSLSSSLNILENDYADATRNKSELDERVFVNEEDSLPSSGSLSGGAMNITMTTAKWLRRIASPLPPKPSPELERFLSSCDSDVTIDLISFDLSKIIGSFIRHEKSLPRELKRHLNSLEEQLLESMVWEKGFSMYNSLTVARPALSAETNRLCLFAEPMPSLDAIAMHMNFTCGSLPCVLSLQKNEISLVKDRLLAFYTPKSKLPPPALQSAFASNQKLRGILNFDEVDVGLVSDSLVTNNPSALRMEVVHHHRTCEIRAIRLSIF
ncbi:Retinoblastoma-related protein [Camellia lanceoleosa]|uniref:Retinoblastoma-related protein n=1 Tax=Camellia lanceoleosa TaxID=1840588 RepID=A0ACC0G8J1_9ERIC|nr:Retinoblastoma-related protein [Camellia lanceoleosa]